MSSSSDNSGPGQSRSAFHLLRNNKSNRVYMLARLQLKNLSITLRNSAGIVDTYLVVDLSHPLRRHDKTVLPRSKQREPESPVGLSFMTHNRAQQWIDRNVHHERTD